MPASPALSFAVAACRSPPDSVKHLEAEPFISHDLNTNRLFRARTFPIKLECHFHNPIAYATNQGPARCRKDHVNNTLRMRGKLPHTSLARGAKRRTTRRQEKPSLRTPRNGVKLLIFQSSHLLGEGHVSTPSRNTRCQGRPMRSFDRQGICSCATPMK
jgi:hypothetical protein